MTHPTKGSERVVVYQLALMKVCNKTQTFAIYLQKEDEIGKLSAGKEVRGERDGCL